MTTKSIFGKAAELLRRKSHYDPPIVETMRVAMTGAGSLLRRFIAEDGAFPERDKRLAKQ